jgi:hypothetical protein
LFNLSRWGRVRDNHLEGLWIRLSDRQHAAGISQPYWPSKSLRLIEPLERIQVNPPVRSAGHPQVKLGVQLNQHVGALALEDRCQPRAYRFGGTP